MKGGSCSETFASNIFIILSIVGIVYLYIYTLLVKRVNEKVRKGIYKLPNY